MRRNNDMTGSLLEGAVQDRRPGKVNIETKGLIDKLISSNNINKPKKDYKKRHKHLIKINRWVIERIKEKRNTKRPKTNNSKGSNNEKQDSWIIKQIKKAFSRFIYPVEGGLRFFLLISTTFMMLLGIVWYTIYFINDVILWESEFHINEQGTINPRKSLNSDYSLFLFNTSEVWANPGIQVNKGDKIRINISGGFNSSIQDVLDDSRKNDTLKYEWRYIGKENLFNKEAKQSDRNDLQYCLSKGYYRKLTAFKKAYHYNFGTILYTIQPESSDLKNYPKQSILDNNDIIPWNAGNSQKTNNGDRAFHKAKQTGYIYFAVNDLVFDEETQIEGYYINARTKNAEEEKKMRSSLNYVYNPFESVSKELSEIKQKDTVEVECKKTYGLLRTINKDNYIRAQLRRNSINDQKILLEQTKVKQDHSFLYKDNLGQLLVAVEIQHHTPWSWLKPHMAFRWFERRVNALSDYGKGLWGYVMKIIGTVFFFLIFFILVVCIFVLWTLICWIIVHALFDVVSFFIDFIDYSSKRIFRTVSPKIKTLIETNK